MIENDNNNDDIIDNSINNNSIVNQCDVRKGMDQQENIKDKQIEEQQKQYNTDNTTNQQQQSLLNNNINIDNDEIMPKLESLDNTVNTETITTCDDIKSNNGKEREKLYINHMNRKLNVGWFVCCWLCIFV